MSKSHIGDIEKLIDWDKIDKVKSEEDIIKLLTPILAKLQQQSIELQQLYLLAKEEEDEGK